MDTATVRYDKHGKLYAFNMVPFITPSDADLLKILEKYIPYATIVEAYPFSC